MKKLLSVVLVALMLFSSVASVLAVYLPELPESTPEDANGVVWVEGAEVDLETNTVKLSVYVKAPADPYYAFDTSFFYPDCLEMIGHDYGAQSDSTNLEFGNMNSRTLIYATWYAFEDEQNQAIFDQYGVTYTTTPGSTYPYDEDDVYHTLDEGWYGYAISLIPSEDYNTSVEGEIQVLTFKYIPEKNIYGDKIPVLYMYDRSFQGDGKVFLEYDSEEYYDNGYVNPVTFVTVPTAEEPTEPEPTTEPTITVQDAEIYPGTESLTIDVLISNNPGVWGMTSFISYDSALKLTSVESVEIFSADEGMTGLQNISFTDLAKKSAYKTLPALFESFGIPTDNASVTIFNVAAAGMKNKTNDGVYLRLTFDTSTLEEGDYEVWVSYKPGDTLNVDGDEVAFDLVSGTITVSEPQHMHIWDDGVVTAPTCTEQGYTTYTCTTGNETKTEDYVDALGHEFSTFVQTVAPTCTSTGYTVYQCVRCDVTEKRDETDMIPHTPGAPEREEPTCTEDGYEEIYCTVCDQQIGDTVVLPATGHTAGTPVRVEPDCTTPGSEKVYCTECDTLIDETEIPALGHDFSVVVETVDPTCTEQGYTTYKCSRCDEKEDRDFVDALGHDFTVKGETVDPTCTEQGYTTYKCERCDETENRDFVDALGHDFTVKGETVDPTCTEQGYTTYKCERCDETEVRDVVDALGHDFSVVVETVDPTCTEQGYTTYKCSRCDETENRDFVDALGHQWGNGVITTAPTTEAEGEKTYTCPVCGNTKVETVAKLEAPAADTEKPADTSSDKTTDTTKPSEQTGDAATIIVFVALISLVCGAALVFTKKKIYNR